LQAGDPGDASLNASDALWTIYANGLGSPFFVAGSRINEVNRLARA